MNEKKNGTGSGMALWLASVFALAAGACQSGVLSDPVGQSDAAPTPPPGTIPGAEAAAVLDGQQILVPCGATELYSDLVCAQQPYVDQPEPKPKCPDMGPWLTLGAIARDETVTFGGTPGWTYNVTLRVRGVVEPKHFSKGGRPVDGSGTNFGWYIDGGPNEVGSYSTFMIGVSSPAHKYFRNAIGYVEAHFAYPIDYTVTLPIDGGASVRFLQSDPTCTIVKNCGADSVEGNTGAGVCNPIVIPDLPGIPQPYNGQFVVVNVVSATP